MYQDQSFATEQDSTSESPNGPNHPVIIFVGLAAIVGMDVGRKTLHSALRAGHGHYPESMKMNASFEDVRRADQPDGIDKQPRRLSTCRIVIVVCQSFLSQA